MPQQFINERQTSNFRKFKYAQLRDAGYQKGIAARMRDWRLPAVIRKIAEAKKIEYALAHYSFYTALSTKKIEMWREEAPEPNVKLSPEEDQGDE